ncbi:Pvc16 family protein [Amycolatopsis sp. NPDC051128]|uniref:Pvc16 family protein n=1 Tax=Amycolatopsis sp. NPDC051128 TaxID=3155412 RepID=UPI003432F93A
MSAATAIGMVSASLRNLLVGEMRLSSAPDVTILAPDEPGSTRRVNLFLYKLHENPFLKNQDFTVRAGNPNQLVPAPLSLNLFYLLTPYAPNDPLQGNATTHQILGEAMRVFYENPSVPPVYLDPGLSGARERLQIAGSTLDPEELSRIWTTFSQPFRLSVLYQVSTVQLDRLPAATRPLAPRVRQVGVPDIRAPFDPPAITGMTPAAGAAGTVLTFTGEKLSGWRGRVLLGDRTILPSQALGGNTFTATLPGDVLPGFYEVRVDVATLARRTFLFEVTP